MQTEGLSVKSDPKAVRSVSPQAGFARRLVRAASFVLKLFIGLIVLPVVCVLWLVLFLLFLPFLIVSQILGWQKTSDAKEKLTRSEDKAAISLCSLEAESADRFVFDRRKDVSKLFGCNTRNVQYRWSIFARRLSQITHEFTNPNALDFGAGSLRDSFELSRLGFRVISVDLDEKLLGRYHDSYTWGEAAAPPELFTRSLDDLSREKGPDFFHLAVAFDVVEHLEDPDAYLNRIRSLLNHRGLLFTIVPNRKSLFERYFKFSIGRKRAHNDTWTRGVPHLQFKSPDEWNQFFGRNGFKIIERDMAIGFFVNDCWNGLLGLPVRVLVCPVLGTLAYFCGVNFNQARFEQAFSPAWLMKRVDVLDVAFKKYFRNRFGWNLIVAQRSQ